MIDGVNSLVTSSTKGHIAVWNLDEQKLDSVLHDAHSGSVNGLSFLPQQPTMITSSSDNSIKVIVSDHMTIMTTPYIYIDVDI